MAAPTGSDADRLGASSIQLPRSSTAVAKNGGKNPFQLFNVPNMAARPQSSPGGGLTSPRE